MRAGAECRFTILSDGTWRTSFAEGGPRPDDTATGSLSPGTLVSTSDAAGTFSFYPSGMAETGTISLTGAFAGSDGAPAKVTLRIYRSGLMRTEDTI